jgi:hypothetical protein
MPLSGGASPAEGTPPYARMAILSNTIEALDGGLEA